MHRELPTQPPPCYWGYSCGSSTLPWLLLQGWSTLKVVFLTQEHAWGTAPLSFPRFHLRFLTFIQLHPCKPNKHHVIILPLLCMILRATCTLIPYQVKPQISAKSVLSTNFPLTGHIHSNYHGGHKRRTKPLSPYFQHLNLALTQRVLSPVFETNLHPVYDHQRDALLSCFHLFESWACSFSLRKESDYICKNQNCDALVVTFLGLHMTYTLYYIGFDIARLSNRVEDYFS